MVKQITVNRRLVLTPENGYYLQSITGLGYNTKYSVNSILSRHGAKLGNLSFTNKKFSLVVDIVGSSPANLFDKRMALYKELTINNYSDDDSVRFDFLLANNLEVSISGVINNVDNPIGVNTHVSSEVHITAETEFPFLTSNRLYSVTVPIAQGGGATVPMEIPLDMTQGAGDAFTLVTNGGNVFSYPTIQFVGPLTNPVLTDVTSGKTLSFAEELTSGQYREIDTYERSVINELGANKLSEMEGDFLVIPAGDDNGFRLTTDNSLETGYVVITYPYSYVSI